MADCNRTVPAGSSAAGTISIPSALPGFFNTRTESVDGLYRIHGEVPLTDEDRVCPECGGRMHVHGTRPDTVVRHLPFGSSHSCLEYGRRRLRCADCGATKMQAVAFQAEGHRMTEPLYRYVVELLARGTYTLKDVAWLTGLHKNVVKAVDEKRLRDRYTVDGEGK